MTTLKQNLTKEKTRVQIFIALISVLTPILITLGIRIFEKDSREISIYYSEPTKVLTETTVLKDKIRLFFDSVNVKNISTMKLVLINSGNIYLSKEDFIDGPIEVLLSSMTDKKINYGVPFLLNVVEVNNAKQRNSQLKFYEKEGVGIIEYLPSLLNPKDRVEIEVFTPCSENIDVDYQGKIKNGFINPPENYLTLFKTSKIEDLINSINNISRFKWISIILFILLFVTQALGTIGFLSINADKNDTPLKAYNTLNLLGKLIFFMMSIITLMYLILLIFITIK